jgi:hypothetical protein
MHAVISEASASDSRAVVCASHMRAEAEVRPDRPPDLRELDDRVGPLEELDVFAVGRPAAERIGNAAAWEALGEALRARRMQPAVATVQKRGVRGDRQEQRQHRAQAVARAHRAIEVAHAQVHVQAEGVVAPRDVLQALLDTAVVLGVDDRLLAIVRPGMGSGGSQRDPLGGGEREQALAALALAGERVMQVRSHARDDLDLR